jgi:hypothetical protein
MSAAKRNEVVDETPIVEGSSQDVGDELEKNTIPAQKHFITLQDNISDVVSWDQAGDTLVFEHQQFLELPEDIVRGLAYENRNNYFMARGMKLAAESAPHLKKRKRLIDPFSNIVLRRVKDIKRRYRDEHGQEWHQAWIDPKNVDAMKGLGYRVVKNDNGESKVIKNGDTDELVCMEVRWQMYDDHIHAMSEKSQEAYTQNIKETEDRVRRQYGLTMLDETDPNQKEYLDWLEGKMQQVRR